MNLSKLLLVGLTFFSFYVNGQIKGDKNIITKSFDIAAFDSLYIGLTATYDVKIGESASLKITMDKNLIAFVEKSVHDRLLTIDQLQWIQPSVPTKIVLTTPKLAKLYQSSHSKTTVQNLKNGDFNLTAEVGEVLLEGHVDNLNVKVGTATVDASGLAAANGNFTFESWGTIKANVSGNVVTQNSNKGKLILNGEGNVRNVTQEIKFLKFELRNNAANRNQFLVVGPKPDGTTFSYGFPMMPFQKRKKEWTNGTKVYKVNNLGLRKLVKVISLEDDGKVVNIF